MENADLCLWLSLSVKLFFTMISARNGSNHFSTLPSPNIPNIIVLELLVNSLISISIIPIVSKKSVVKVTNIEAPKNILHLTIFVYCVRLHLVIP